nr:MAG TPA: Acetone carboxylase alpha subunit [Caudoviricetes sp.]
MNLEGQRFGKLVVIKKGETRVTKGGCKTRTWICRCDCGRELIISTGHLRSGNTKSCGCLRGIDITGQKFGKLTAIKRTKKRDKTGNIYWYCECECGGNIITQGRNLIKIYCK